MCLLLLTSTTLNQRLVKVCKNNLKNIVKKRLCPETEPHNNDQKPVTSEQSTFLGIVIKARKKARECKAKAVIEFYGNLV